MLDRADLAQPGQGGHPRETPRRGLPPLWLPAPVDRCACHAHGRWPMSRPWLAPVRFDYAVSADRFAAVRLLAKVDAALGPPSPAWLVVRRAELQSRHAPNASETVIDQVFLWQVSFRLPLELVEYPRARFDLETSDGVAIALPAPTVRADAADVVERELKPRMRPLLRRSIVGFATGLAVAAVSSSFVGVASAASVSQPTTAAPPSSSPPMRTALRTTIANQTSEGGQAHLRPDAVKRPSSASPNTKTSTSNSNSRTSTPRQTTTAPRTAHSPAGATVPPSSGHHSDTKSDSKPPAGCALTTIPDVAASVSSSASAGGRAAPSDAAAPPDGKAKSPKTGHLAARGETATGCAAPHKKKKREKKKLRRHAPGKPATSTLPSSGGAGLTPPLPVRRVTGKKSQGDLARRFPSDTAAAALPVPSSPWSAGFGIDPFTAAEIARFSTVSASLEQPPAFLIVIYKAAGRKYKIPWQILAAINAVETNYGRDLAVSPKGAFGWMQFMPGTWIEYAVDASGSRRPNPYDPRDAIFSAARLLAANGGARDIRHALFSYNHALWYVDAVLWRAALISDGGLDSHLGSGGYALPLDSPYMAQLGRTDDGVDIEDAPDGAAVYSMTPGVVTAVASDPGGFGPDYPVVLVTAGPLAGQYVYYGHVAASMVTVGEHVDAGQPIAVMGHTGDAAGLGHGHIEIGFSDGSGDPLNHHGAVASTPSGAVMRTVLVALSSASGIKN